MAAETLCFVLEQTGALQRPRFLDYDHELAPFAEWAATCHLAALELDASLQTAQIGQCP